MIEVTETDEERAAREAAEYLHLLDVRARRALRGAPDLLLHVRSLAVNGQSERGETLPEWTAPMRITAADDCDEVYAQLVDWVIYWAGVFDTPPPVSAVLAWSVNREVQGLRAGTTAEGAHTLTQAHTAWLLLRADDIATQPSAPAYLEDVNDLLFRLGAKYPLKVRPPRPVSLRPCPSCGERAVGAEWASEDVLDVVVSCEFCALVLPTPRPSDVAKWLPELGTGETLSQECEQGQHPYCSSLSCGCFCHQVREDALVARGKLARSQKEDPR